MVPLGDRTGNARKRTGEVAPAGPQWLLSGAGCIASGNPFLKPGLHLLFDQPDPSGTETHPLGELSGRLQAGNMLRRVENCLANGLFR